MSSFPLPTLIETVGRDKWFHRIGKYKCHCGKEFTALELSIKPKHQVSCGCKRKNRLYHYKYRHGESGRKATPEFRIWNGMIQRCYKKDHVSYKYYGKRGIIMYPAWKESYQNFLNYLLDTIGRRPSKKYSIDRINNDGNYIPNNIKWSTRKEQQNNRRYSYGKTK